MLELSDISTLAVIERNDEILAGDIAIQAVADSGVREVRTVSFTFEAQSEASNRAIKTNMRATVRSLVLLIDNAQKFLGKPNEKAEGRIVLRLDADVTSSSVCFIVFFSK